MHKTGMITSLEFTKQGFCKFRIAGLPKVLFVSASQDMPECRSGDMVKVKLTSDSNEVQFQSLKEGAELFWVEEVFQGVIVERV